MSGAGDDLRATGTGLWYILLGLVLVGGVLFGVTWLGGFWSSTTAEQRGQTGVRENTVGSGQYRIARYDEFFDRCNAVVSLEDQIELTQQKIADDQQAADTTALFYDKQNLTALQNQRFTQIGAYNADASKAGTAGQFRDSSLPQKIDPKGTTSCS